MVNPIGVALRNRRAGQHTLLWARPELQAPESFALTSPAFVDGGAIPARFRGRMFAPNISPPLAWTPPPASVVELVLIVQDPDVPFGRPATHALCVGIDPQLGAIAENALAHPSTVAGLTHGRGALGRRGWSGPMPVPSHGAHSYVFQLFAVDRSTALTERFTLDDVLAAISGAVVARARLDGTYEIA